LIAQTVVEPTAYLLDVAPYYRHLSGTFHYATDMVSIELPSQKIGMLYKNFELNTKEDFIPQLFQKKIEETLKSLSPTYSQSFANTKFWYLGHLGVKILQL